MMRIPSFMLALALLAAPAPAQDEKKNEKKEAETAGVLELRAASEMEARAWDKALPLLKRIAVLVKDDPQRLETIQERIRVCERNLAKGKDPQKEIAAQDPAAQDAEPEIPTAPGKRKVHPAPKPGETIELDIKQLGNFEYDPDTGLGIPEDVKRLSGQKVRMSGFMSPIDQAENISEFALVTSLFACCFGQPPQVQHIVIVHCPPGQSVEYTADEIVCEGTLTVREKKDDGFVISIFEMDVTSVKPAPQ